jgi:hypothetical protein
MTHTVKNNKSYYNLINYNIKHKKISIIKLQVQLHLEL